MDFKLHKAETRGRADHGWLRSAHSFSFASYYNPERMGFGMLRVINDDHVAPGQGFPSHPHQNMEIISVPLKGSLRHKDSEGNSAVIQSGEVQLMSAGKGVFHSEFNNSETEDVNFLQIWVMPKKQNIVPRYDQKEFHEEARKNQLQMIVSPIGTEFETVKINQDAYFYLSDLSAEESINVETRHEGNGLYIFSIEGDFSVAGTELSTRDALGIEGVDGVNILARTDSKILIIEVPMSHTS